MMRSLILAAATCLAVAVPVSAATVFSDNFAADTAALNGSLLNFDVEGRIDVVSDGTYGITIPGGGKAVDLDGSPGAGKITSKQSFAFNAGDRITLSGLLSGSQRSTDFDDLFFGLFFTPNTDFVNYVGTGHILTNSPGFGPICCIQTTVRLAGTAAFVDTSLAFTALNAGSLKFFIGTGSRDNVGPVVTNVRLDISAQGPAPVPLPAAGWLLLAGLGGLAALKRKRA